MDDESIPKNAPTVDSNYEKCSKWLETYGQACYSSSIFVKRPLLAVTSTNIELTSLPSILSINLYKITKTQSTRTAKHWWSWKLAKFSPRYSLPGLRKSSRNRTIPDYYYKSTKNADTLWLYGLNAGMLNFNSLIIIIPISWNTN